MNRRHVQEITLKDFRCFHQQQTARLAPLTLLVGENSTGKTSFLAAVRAVMDIAYWHGEPDFRAPPYDLGAFPEIAHNQGGRRNGADSFNIGFRRIGKELPSILFDANFVLGAGAAPVPSIISWRADDAWIRYVQSSGETRFEFGTSDGAWARVIPVEDSFHDLRAIGGRGFFLMDFALWTLYDADDLPGKMIRLQGSRDTPDERDIKLFRRIYNEFSRFSLHSIFAGAPIRSRPLRTYDPVTVSPDPEGSYVPAFIASIHFRDKEMWRKIKKSMEDFGRRSRLFDEIFVRQLGRSEGDPFQLEVTKYGTRRKGARRNLIDVGYGVSQILPVLVEVFRPSRAPMFLFQQPETHLHPRAQAALGSMLCATAASGRQLIVETHSDYILDRILLDIRDERTKLKPEDVSILYFEREDMDVSIHSIRIDEKGNVLDTPEGYRNFFKDELNRVIDY